MSQNRSTEVEGLFQISPLQLGIPRAEVVFVHGLEGHWEETWQAKQWGGGFWPSWLGEDHPELGVWSLGYEAHSSGWFGSAMPLADRAKNALEYLRVEGLAKAPLVFVTHSLGGILFKKMLRHAQDLGGGELRHVLGVVFLATPHAGSGLASFAKVVPRIFRPSTLVYELAGAHPELRELNSWYRDNYRKLGVRNKVFYETKRTWLLRVVQEDRADPGLEGIPAIPVAEDHFSICKPRSKKSLVYRAVSAFIEECVAEPQKPAVAKAPKAEPAVEPQSTTKRPETEDSPRPAASRGKTSFRNPEALRIWEERLAYFEQEEAKTADPAQKFSLRQQIEECRRKIREYGGEA